MTALEKALQWDSKYGEWWSSDNQKIAELMDEYLQEKIKETLETLKKENPYPESVFTEPTKEEYGKMQKAMAENGLIPDRFFGSWGRTVWQNCIKRLEDILGDEE